MDHDRPLVEAGAVVAAAELLQRIAADALLGLLCPVVLAGIAELFQKQLKVDDNFSIPLCVGLVLLIGSKI